MTEREKTVIARLGLYSRANLYKLLTKYLDSGMAASSLASTLDTWHQSCLEIVDKPKEKENVMTKQSGTFTRDSDGEKFELVYDDGDHWKADRRIVIKPVQTKRWRAEEDDKYWFVDGFGDARHSTEVRHTIDNLKYELGNYFQTREQAEAAAEAVKAVFDFLHAPEVGGMVEEKDKTFQMQRKLDNARQAVQGDKS